MHDSSMVLVKMTWPCTNFQILDADKGRRLESSTGRIATRDIVQFVPMREIHSEQLDVFIYKILYKAMLA